MVESEGKMAKLEKNDKVIILGGGSLPLSALTYTKVFGVQCTCIDIDERAVITSRLLIKHLNLENKIEIQLGDAFEYALEGYDLILVVCLLPKKEALRHVFAENAKSKVIYRSAIGLYKLWYGKTSKEDIDQYRILKAINTDKRYAAASYLITPR
jgi:histidine 2-aminobutanoyltransferase